MRTQLSTRLKGLKIEILEVGLFVLFVVTFGDYLISKIWAVIAPALAALAR